MVWCITLNGIKLAFQLREDRETPNCLCNNRALIGVAIDVAGGRRTTGSRACSVVYGNETWVLMDLAVRCLEGFYRYRVTRKNRPTEV